MSDDFGFFDEGVEVEPVQQSKMEDIYEEKEKYPEYKPKPGVTPPEEYDRVNATVAPDGSPLSEIQIQKPHLMRAGDPPRKGAFRNSIAKGRVNVREIVTKLTSDTKLGPIEVLFHIMNADDESRAHLGMTKSEKISANLRAKCATELLAYMAPKLKSVEVKEGDSKSKRDTAHIFLPSNTREEDNGAPKIILPEKDGVSIPMSPELAKELVQEITSEDEEQDFED